MSSIRSSGNSHALVIGAGIGGLAAAIALRRAGWEATVYERSADLAPVGAGISLWTNALAALGRLGVREAVRALSVPATNAGLRTSRGGLLVGAASSALVARFGEFAIVVHRAALQRILLDAAGPERVFLGRECTGIDSEASGVTARFRDGSVVRGDALVGADGLRSVVRAHLHGDTPPRYSGYTAWRGVVRFDHHQLQMGESWGRGQRFGQMPLHAGDVYWFATANVTEGARSADGEKAELLRRFRGWHDPIGALIDATPEAAILRNDICDRPPLRRWGRGRVTLLGDAAHPMTPNLGQGGCQALEDAVALGRSLTGAPSTDADTDTDTALRAYEAARIPRTTFMVKASRRVGTIAQIENRALVLARDFFVRHIGGRMQARQIAALIDHTV